MRLCMRECAHTPLHACETLQIWLNKPYIVKPKPKTSSTGSSFTPVLRCVSEQLVLVPPLHTTETEGTDRLII
ncbi:hypothetical protein AMECASPLE_007959 [Ameca splendens]|uniref:Uncharacterized protein n=1 Tax=Ameca splendens TaxID=208324 RepID=A0ABV0YYJ0_9TELE